MKITFLNPPYLKNFSRSQRSPAVTKSGTLYYPLWLASAAGFAELRGGHTIDLIDAPAQDLEKQAVLERVKTFAPSLLVVETSTPSIYSDAAICQLIKDVLPQLFIVMVGTHVSALPEASLQLGEGVDAVAIGEYDQTILELADILACGGDPVSVSGLCLRQETELVRTGKRQYLADLDQIPFVSGVYKRFLNIENYFNPNALFPMVTITTSRGCPHRCIFCVYPQAMMGHTLRTRSVANVISEIEFIQSAFPTVKSIFFEDDTFPANKKRCLAICEEMIRRKISISWTANARADLDYETMRVMKAAGCRCLCVGFESGSQQLLDNIKKGIDVARTHDFMNDARRAGLLIHGCFIVGHPGETRETMSETLNLAIKLKPESAQFYPVMVYPGTAAYAWYDERNLISTKDFAKWLTPAGLHNTVVRGEELTAEELVRFCDHARKTFYLRPGYLLHKGFQMLVHPKEVRGNLKSAKTFLKYLIMGSDVEKS